MSSIALFYQQATGVPVGAAADPTGGLMQTLFMLVPMIAIFYFLILRPQNQRMKKHREMLGALKKGDEVVTQGGIIGKISKLTDNEITIDTGEGQKLRVVRAMVMGLHTVGNAPAPANDVKES
jgi:preprotein translocase subunit YajC